MPSFNIANSRGRDAIVWAESVGVSLRVRWIDHESRQVSNFRLLKGTVNRDLDSLVRQAGSLDAVGQALVAGDPEVDIETYGSIMRDTSRVFVNADKEVVHKIHMWEIIRNVDGTEKTRRPKAMLKPNVTDDQPLRWTGKFMPKKEVFNKFVFARKVQLMHVNGLTYDFLFEMAQELEKKDSLMLVGAGPKGNQPIVLRRNATPYRGFLEGRTRGAEYLLLLHLSNLELKGLSEPEEEAS